MIGTNKRVTSHCSFLYYYPKRYCSGPASRVRVGRRLSFVLPSDNAFGSERDDERVLNLRSDILFHVDNIADFRYRFTGSREKKKKKRFDSLIIMFIISSFGSRRISPNVYRARWTATVPVSLRTDGSPLKRHRCGKQTRQRHYHGQYVY